MGKIDKRHTYSRRNIVRPGWVIYGVLSGRLDIIPGIFVTEASAAELWCAYKRQLYLINYSKGESDIQPGLTLQSFRSYLRMAYGLKLIKYMRTHPPEYELYADSLRYMTEGDLFEYTSAMRKVFQLTPRGLGSRDWNRISTKYHEKFPGKSKKA